MDSITTDSVVKLDGGFLGRLNKHRGKERVEGKAG